jgi:Flp pilus assembly protein protease CpaA
LLGRTYLGITSAVLDADSYSNGSLYLIIFGALFLVVILFMPQGIVVFLRDAWLRRKARRDGRVTVGAAVSPGSGVVTNLLKVEGRHEVLRRTPGALRLFA